MSSPAEPGPAFDHTQAEDGDYLDDMAETALPTVHDAAAQAACPDCPATRQHAFEHMVKGPRTACAFQCMTLDSRSPIPDRWFGAYGAALVRRGVMIRQRVDAHGRATAIDAAGPGCLVPLESANGPTATAAYAATRLLVCLCPREVMEAAVDQRDDPAATDLLRMQREAIERLERIADARARSNVESRVSALLCALADTLSPPRRRTRIPSGLQQRDLAVLLSIRHESVCRALGTLESRGALLREPDGIRITDRELLETI